MASSALIQSDDATIRDLGVKLAGDARNPRERAERLTAGVYQAITKKNFSHGFDSAREVAKHLEGDCTEHAVLLAALLRSQNIASRLASGLVYQTDESGPNFGYHLWTEAWVDERWLPLDPTRGEVVGCDYIKFLETPLAESNPYTALLPVLSSIGQLRISVIAQSP